MPLWACGATPCGKSRLDHSKGASDRTRLRQVESYLKDTGMAALALAWAMARWRPKYRRKVDAATRCSGICPHA